MSNALEHLSGMTRAPLEEVALAIAAEFRIVDVEGARANLDLLAAGLDGRLPTNPESRAEALVSNLAGTRGLGACACSCPESLMLDQVLDLRRGHPLALCVVHVAVARRLGFELNVVGSDRLAMVADASVAPPLLIDPVPGGSGVSQGMSWLCPHVVGSRMLGLLVGRFLTRGSIGEAIRAAELHRLLPLAGKSRERHEAELRSLRARLN